MSASPYDSEVRHSSAPTSPTTLPGTLSKYSPPSPVHKHKHKHHSVDISHTLSSRAYLVEGRPRSHQDGHPTRPQSALLREPAPLSPSSSAHLSPDARRTSFPHSVPTPAAPSISSATFERRIKSENASLSTHDWRHNTAGDTSPRPMSSKHALYHQHKRPASVQKYVLQPSSPMQAFTSYSLSDTEHDGADSDPAARHTCRSLMHVCLFAAPLSFGICFYTLLVLLFSLCTSPFRLCLKQERPLSSQISSRLLGPLNLQRRCIYVAPVLAPSSRSSSSSRTPLSSNEAVEAQNSTGDSSVPVGPLVTIHLLSPIISLPLALCAWIMAVAWGLSAMVSDEAAGDDRDERRLAQRLVDYWAVWLDWRMDFSQQEHISNDRRGRSRARPEMTMV